MVVDHSIHLSYCDDRQNCIRCTNLAIGVVYDLSDRWIYLHHMDGSKNLPGRYSYARHKSELQGAGQVVYDEELSLF